MWTKSYESRRSTIAYFQLAEMYIGLKWLYEDKGEVKSDEVFLEPVRRAARNALPTDTAGSPSRASP